MVTQYLKNNGQILKKEFRMRVNLILLSANSTMVQWDMGSVYNVAGTPKEISNVLTAEQQDSSVDYWLIWDAQLGNPDFNKVLETISEPGDVWHAGLNLGMRGEPDILKFVCPGWTLIIDPDSDIESSSWRLSLRCCLFKADVLRQMGGPSELFDTLEAASLELGYRYVNNGVFTRYIPGLSGSASLEKVRIPIQDQFKFLSLYYPKQWCYWSLCRALLKGRINSLHELKSILAIIRETKLYHCDYYHHPLPEETIKRAPNASVSVLIPTLSRYSYLTELIPQLESQTVKPEEIIVVDQTPAEQRQKIASTDPKIGLKVIYMDQPGQCSARNLGLSSSSGDYILFLDDDTEIPQNLIELHLENLERFRTNISCGTVDDLTAREVLWDFSFFKISPVFSTCNALVKTQVLNKTGLFDQALDRKSNEDGELFMRMYLQGELMVLSPNTKIIHYHAPSGGLRTHGQRKITYASSRKSLFERRLPNHAEFYILKRYYDQESIHESFLLSILGTFSVRGNFLRKAAKTFISLFLLPDTIIKMARAEKEAGYMLSEVNPDIPPFAGRT